MSVAYVLTSGDYSDYHIIAVCSTLENAERLKRLEQTKFRYYSDSIEIEEWELDEEVRRLDEPLVACFVSQWNWDAPAPPENLKVNFYGPEIKMPELARRSNETLLYSTDTIRLVASKYGYGRYFEVYVAADDLEKATKIANDFWAEFQYKCVEESK